MQTHFAAKARTDAILLESLFQTCGRYCLALAESNSATSGDRPDLNGHCTPSFNEVGSVVVDIRNESMRNCETQRLRWLIAY